MNESFQFHLIESQQQHLSNHPVGHNFFQQQKIAFPFHDQLQKDVDQESILKTPKSKRGRKISLKNNPEECSGAKITKIRDKKYKNMLPDKQKNSNQLFGHWSDQQNKKYHWFLEIYHTHFMNRSLRRMDRIFTSMARFVNSRQAQQCRSHHQKMEKKHKTFPKILLNLRMIYYGSHEDGPLREEMDQNQVNLIDPLLTKQFLLENQLQKDLSLLGSRKEEANSESDEAIEEYELKQAKTERKPKADSEGIIDQAMAQDYQSSKNQFKFVILKDRNDILDDGYEKNLPFNNFF